MIDLSQLSDEEFRLKLAEVVNMSRNERQEHQIRYFQPVSKMAERVWDSRARVLGIGGGNRCLPLHAPVMMADGSWKPLGDVAVGDMVIAADPSSGLASPAPVTATWRSGKKPVYRVRFSDGGFFDATADHMVPMFLGSGRVTSKGNAKVASKRRLGDYIEPITRRGGKNPSKRISCVSPADITLSVSDGIRIDPYLLGALLGDGSFPPSGIKFHNADAGVVEKVAQCAANAGCRLTSHGGYNYGIAGPAIRFNPVLNEIRRLGLSGTNSYTKFIPDAAMRLPRKQRLELLAGLVDTDGSIDSYSTCSGRLAENFTQLVRSLGGKATVAQRTAMCQNGVAVETYGIYFRLAERLPIALARKQKPTSKRPVDYTRRVCRSAELLGAYECGDITVDHPSHCYVTGDYVIVSNSSKTDSCLALLTACATGIFPDSMLHHAPDLFRGPIRVRIICDSLTTTLYPTILPKLQWWKWSGMPPQGGTQGHWGWIPPYCLKERQWDKSWSEKLRILTVQCRDPFDNEVILGESIFHFMSYDQEEGRGTDFHYVMHDEPPPLHIWRESEARVMGVGGRMLLAMTWPDDPSIPVDWLFDEVYEPGMDPERKDIEWLNLFSTDNKHIDLNAVEKQAKSWSEETKRVRIFGQPIRFSNRIHPLFTDQTSHWCFPCGKVTFVDENPAPTGEYDRLLCSSCRQPALCEFNHVKDFHASEKWPTIQSIDPHPRKPHMALWVMVDPSDDLWVIDELHEPGDPTDVRRESDVIEARYGLKVPLRLIDPNMGMQSASSKRDTTWQGAFQEAGLATELADDSEVGRASLNQYLKPDERRQQPRIHVHTRCTRTIAQIKRYVWDDFKRAAEKDQKQVPKAKNDDYPTLLKYVMNYHPSFSTLRGMGMVHNRATGRRRGAK